MPAREVASGTVARALWCAGVDAVLALEFPWQQIQQVTSKRMPDNSVALGGGWSRGLDGGGTKTDRKSEIGSRNLLSLLDKWRSEEKSKGARTQI